MKSHDTSHEPAGANYAMVLMISCCLLLLAAVFFVQPGANGYGLLLFLLVLACPLMHLFMHRGHTGH